MGPEGGRLDKVATEHADEDLSEDGVSADGANSNEESDVDTEQS